MTKALSIKADSKVIAEIEAVTKECNLSVLESHGDFERALTMAAGITKLETLITDDMMKDIMALQGNSLGFRTDKDKDKGYPLAVVKRCFIEATLRGVHGVGNEFNIISARSYVTKEGFTRLLREIEGLTDLKLFPGIPNMKSGGAIVTYKATWKLDGIEDSIEREIPIRVNSGMGADAILGKAERKIRKAIYEQITGSENMIPDGEVGDDANTVTAKTVKRSAANDELPADNKDERENALAAEQDELFNKTKSAVQE